jgi:hypothetical protein
MFLQMGITFVGSASMAPWYIKPIIDGFVGKVKVSTRYTAWSFVTFVAEGRSFSL